jgi:hypothetical protein
MINTITVTNHRSESVVLDLRNPAPSGFFIRGVDGLGPTKATINTSQSLSLDGSTFNSARQEQRNIVFKLGFLDNPTIEQSRQNSYKYFPLKRPVMITIATDNKTVWTTGYVESNEPDIFSRESGNVVSIICPNPYFYGVSEAVVYFSAITGLFEFPFSNESLTEKLIEFGTLTTEPQQNVLYNGEVSVGFRMYVTISGPVENITIYNISTGQSMLIDTDILTALMGSPLGEGDQIIISTIKGDKYVTLVRDGVGYNILNALGPDSDWFTLERGDNVFYYTADVGETNVKFEIRYQLLFEGI